jgi:hypothetical protein
VAEANRIAKGEAREAPTCKPTHVQSGSSLLGRLGNLPKNNVRLHAEQMCYYGHHTPSFGRVKLSNDGKWRICNGFLEITQATSQLPGPNATLRSRNIR